MAKSIKKIFIIAGLSLLVFPIFVFAQNRAAIDVSIPCISCAHANDPSPVGLIANFYELAIAFSGVLALGIIIYAGIIRIINANNPGKVGESNDMIYNALLGIVLLFGAYILLNTINPQLTKLELPALSEIEAPAGAGGGAGGIEQYQFLDVEGKKVEGCYMSMDACASACSETRCSKVLSCIVSGVGACPIGNIPEITDPEALAMENGTKVIWTASTEPAKSNLQRLQTEFNKLKSALGKVGASATANSVYRPMAYQKHFYDIKTVHDRFLSLTPEEKRGCSALESQLRAEEAKHGICPSKTEKPALLTFKEPE